MYFAKTLVSLPTTVAVAVLLSSTSSAEEKISTFRGYLLDKQCGDSVKEDSDPEDFIKHHTKDCALMPNCRRKGYSLFAKPDWYDLDKHGNKLAVKLLQNSKRRSAFFVQVKGSSSDGLLKVKSIEEVESPATQENAETK